MRCSWTEEERIPEWRARCNRNPGGEEMQESPVKQFYPSFDLLDHKAAAVGAQERPNPSGPLPPVR
jgi:hypothetical protein